MNVPGIYSKYPITLLASESRYQYIRCLEPSFNSDVLVAAGLANGKVGLCNFNHNVENVEFSKCYFISLI